MTAGAARHLVALRADVVELLADCLTRDDTGFILNRTVGTS
jgi:hypothetical protein